MMIASRFHWAGCLGLVAVLGAAARASEAPLGPPPAMPFVLLHSLRNPNAIVLGDLLNGASIAIDGNFAVVGSPDASVEGLHDGMVKVYRLIGGAFDTLGGRP